jgi:hypothetical protein
MNSILIDGELTAILRDRNQFSIVVDTEIPAGFLEKLKGKRISTTFNVLVIGADELSGAELGDRLRVTGIFSGVINDLCICVRALAVSILDKGGQRCIDASRM